MPQSSVYLYSLIKATEGKSNVSCSMRYSLYGHKMKLYLIGWISLGKERQETLSLLSYMKWPKYPWSLHYFTNIKNWFKYVNYLPLAAYARPAVVARFARQGVPDTNYLNKLNHESCLFLDFTLFSMEWNQMCKKSKHSKRQGFFFKLFMGSASLGHILVENRKERQKYSHRLHNFHWWIQYTHQQF